MNRTQGNVQDHVATDPVQRGSIPSVVVSVQMLLVGVLAVGVHEERLVRGGHHRAGRRNAGEHRR